MGRLSGIVLILAGMVVGAYALSWPQATAVGTAVREPADTDKKAQTAAVVVEPVTAPGKAPAPTVAPQTVAVAPPPAPMLAPPAADAAQPKAPAPPAVANPPPPAPAAAKAITPPSVEPPVAKAPPQPPASKPAAVVGLPLDRTALTKELQRHLTRVGCYEGDINGVWTPAVRRSMKAFTDRVNATLPIEQPDYILLAMVQNHQDKACGRTCPPGQGLADDGRCLPNAIIARATKKQAPVAQPGLVAKAVPPPADKKAATSENRPTTTAAPGTPAPRGPMAPPRMALAGPKQEPPAAPAKSGPPLAPSQVALAKRDQRYRRSVRRPTYAERRNRERRRVAGWSSRFAYPSWAQPRSMP